MTGVQTCALPISLRAGEAVEIADVTEDYGVLVVSGPRSRDLLAKLTDADLGNATFPWLSEREIEVAGVALRALRISYVGELGWELHMPIGEMKRVYDAVMAAGEPLGVADFGLYAKNSLRMEKAYRGWGAELTNEITMIEADMERFVAYDKGDFIGRAALLKQKQEGVSTRLVYLAIEAGDADAMGNEPVLAEGRVVGVTTSGGYGHAVGRSLAFAYVEPALAEPGTALSVSILGEDRPARVLAGPAYDAKNARLRG